MESQRTLVLLKPDALQRGLVGPILSRLEARGLKFVALKLLQMDRGRAERLYQVHRGKGFYEGLVRYITSGPVVALVVQGPQAVEVVRQMMGATDPLKAPPGTIRGDWGLDIARNLIHGSDSPQSAEQEIPIFFSEEEMVDWGRDLEGWLTPPE